VPHSSPVPDRTDASTAVGVLAEANRAHGLRFCLLDGLGGGFQSGTWLLGGPGGSPGDAPTAVLKWAPRRESSERILRAATAVRKVRAAGYRTPAWLAAGVSGDGFPYHVQRFVPGGSAPALTADIAGRLVPLLESQRGLDADPGHRWSRYVQDQLAGGGDGARRALAASGARAREFVAALDALVTASGGAELPADDLVHGDFRLGNVLFSPERAPTAVDVEALGSGTRAYDYATLLTEDTVDPAGWEVIRTAGERVAGLAVLARCFALVAFELVDFVRLRDPGRLPVLLGPLTDRARALAT
jgi:aminoglycoside phosphotransferase (APT) family kinase protein